MSVQADGTDSRTSAKCALCSEAAHYAWDAFGGVCCMEPDCPLHGQPLTVEAWDELWAERERGWNHAQCVATRYDRLWHEKMKSDGRANKAEKLLADFLSMPPAGKSA